MLTFRTDRPMPLREHLLHPRIILDVVGLNCLCLEVPIKWAPTTRVTYNTFSYRRLTARALQIRNETGNVSLFRWRLLVEVGMN